MNMTVKYMNPVRFINILKIYSSFFLSSLVKKQFVWGLPPIVMIEITNFCNLKCPLCPSGTGQLNRPRGYMSFETFKKIVDEVHQYAFMLILWNQGEPFLNKDFLKMCSYASSKNLLLLVSTNANYIPDPEGVVKAGIDRIIISADGATQETYNRYRVNGNLENVINNVKNIVEAKKNKLAKLPKIIWQFIVMKHNEHEINEIRKITQEIGVDTLQLKTVQIYSKDDIYNFLPNNPKYRRYKITNNDFELKYGIKNKCRRLWTQPVVNWDGEVAVCCFDKDNDYKIGNINNTSLAELWTSSRFTKFRDIILKNRSSIEICRNCGEGVSLKIKSN